MCAVRMKPFSKCCEVGLTKEGELPGGLPEKNRHATRTEVGVQRLESGEHTASWLGQSSAD